MLSTNDYTIFQRRQAELLKRAEIEQLLRQSKIDRPQTLPLPRRGAFWLGAHLVKWGQQLERVGNPGHCEYTTPVSARSSSL